MSLNNLSSSQLRHASTIKERIETLQRELNQILGYSSPPAGAAAAADPTVTKPKSKMSPAAKAKLSAKLKLVWAQRKAAQNKTTPPTAPAQKARVSKMSASDRANLSAKLKAYWAKRKAARK